MAAVVVGARLGEQLGPGPAIALLVSGLLGAIAALFLPRRRARLALAVAAVAMLATASMQRALDGQAHSPLTALRDARAAATITATLTDDPDGGQYNASVLARVSRVGGRSAGARTVLVSAGGDAAGKLRLLESGDEVQVSGWLQPLSGYDERLRWRHAVASFDAVELRAFDPARSPLHRTANFLRARVLAGGRHLAPTERALMAGFLLGDTRELPRDVEEQFRAAGLTHLLAVSGANVAFVLALVRPVLRRLPLRAQLVAGLTVLVVFGTMTRWEPSVLRACAMAACSMTALYLGRPTAGIRVLALAVVVLVLADPFLVHSIGFLLSCGASAGIAVLAPAITARVPGPHWLREPLGVTLAAQIGVAPVLIPVFGSVPLAALPANLVAGPIAGPLTVLGLATGVAGGVVESWWPSLAALLQAPTALLARAMLGVAAFFSRLPVDVDGRAAWAIIAGTSLLGAAKLWSGRRRNLRVDALSSR
ncbi:MAG TPA: ComEC/Rec2 family competence protein [Acidimicrobiia bacterium]